MDAQRSETHISVTSTDTAHHERRIRPIGVAPGALARDADAAGALVAQTRNRIAAAGIATLVQLGVVLLTGRPGLVAPLVAIAVAYVALVATLGVVLARTGRAGSNTVTAALLLDLGFIVAATAAGSPPANYERALFGMMVVVHVANFYFGRRQAWRLLPVGIVAYGVLLGSALQRGLAVNVVEEGWSLVVSAVGTSLILLHASDVRRRLRTLVTLFERTEEGDFSHAYDEAADVRSDAITRVGRAYNRLRVQLASMVLTDPLTGCLNRRGFDQALARESSRAMRAGSEVALLAIDLDHFKMINDTWGHMVGDTVLRDTGQLLLQAVRGGDVVARVGGEEFAVLLADTSTAGATLFATRLCDLIRSHRFVAGSGRDERLPVQASVGVVAGAPSGAKDFTERLWAHADAALYTAKRSGRDQARAWTAHQEDPVLPVLAQEPPRPDMRRSRVG